MASATAAHTIPLLVASIPHQHSLSRLMLTVDKLNGIRCVASLFLLPREEAANPSEGAVIDTVMRDASVDIDRNLIIYYVSLFVSSGEPTLAADVCENTSRTRQTHGENLSPNVKTYISNAMFNRDTKLGACQSSHVLRTLAHILRFSWRSIIPMCFLASRW